MTMTVGQYLNAAATDPRLRRTTHHYISDMIDYFGPEQVFEGVYGMERQLTDIVAYFKAYSMSMERRLLLLVGANSKVNTYDRRGFSST